MTPGPTPRDLPDRLLREMLAHPDHLRTVLRRAVPHLADQFLYEQAQVLERLFPLDDWRNRESDLLVQLPYRGVGQAVDALVVILLEHQSAPDPRMPLRTLLYAMLWWERQLAATCVGDTNVADDSGVEPERGDTSTKGERDGTDHCRETLGRWPRYGRTQ